EAGAPSTFAGPASVSTKSRSIAVSEAAAGSNAPVDALAGGCATAPLGVRKARVTGPSGDGAACGRDPPPPGGVSSGVSPAGVRGVALCGSPLPSLREQLLYQAPRLRQRGIELRRIRAPAAGGVGAATAPDAGAGHSIAQDGCCIELGHEISR